ncbi:MAG: hypothetical protein ABH826_03300 [Patescibacteria group bacterium]|nr:hypothetical protein [Patescibacteria group bacterium]
MKKSLKAAAGAMFLIACGDAATPPSEAHNITEAQQEIIEADLDRLEVQSEFVKKLLDYADPLPDLTSGKKMDDNEHVKELIDQSLVDGQWYLENDHFLIANTGDINLEDINELAPGIQTNYDITDNYVIILQDPAVGEFSGLDSGKYMHSFSRFYYPVDNLLVTNEALVENDPIVGQLMNEFYGIDTADDFLDPLDYAEGSLETLQSIRERLDDDTLEEDWAEQLGDKDFDEELERVVRYYYQRIADFEDKTEDEIFEDNLKYEIQHVQENMDFYAALGVTDDEYLVALRASKDMFEPANPERVELMLRQVTDMFPEYNFEIREGMKAEVDTERIQEPFFESHGESSRK